jgi:hypothetical protein
MAVAEDQDSLSILLQLEATARSADTEKALQFLFVNETRRLVSFRQAFLFSAVQHRYRVEAASSISVLDRNSPLIRWLENISENLIDQNDLTMTQQFDIEICPETERDNWKEYSLPFVLWVPLVLADKTLLGGLWLVKETRWRTSEITLVERLAGTYAHAWAALVGRKRIGNESPGRRKLAWGVVAALVLVNFLPVRLSAIAPVEIVPNEPVIVSAPMDGVIKEIPAQPNTFVAEGDVIFIYEDTNLRNSYEIAKKSYEVAVARLRKATQGAFQDSRIKAQMSLLKAESELKETELNFAKELLGQVVVVAKKDGLLLYSEKSDWVGRPVSLGQRIMEVANPSNVKLKIDLPVSDAIVLREGVEVEIFLDINPLQSLSARVTHTGFNADLTPAGVLAYRIDAKFDEDLVDVRIGLQGSAKIYGEDVSLFFYLFRRPIASLRQFAGL